jgi:hypothetical protein
MSVSGFMQHSMGKASSAVLALSVCIASQRDFMERDLLPEPRKAAAHINMILIQYAWTPQNNSRPCLWRNMPGC